MNMLNLPKKVYFKPGCTGVALRELSEIYGCKRALLVTDPGLYKSNIVSTIDSFLMKHGIRTAEFFSISLKPTYAEIMSGMPKVDEFQPDAIIGIGGGAAMSAAKAMYMLYENPGLTLAEAAKAPEKIKEGKKAKLVMAATSFGSGAQNSPFILLADDEGNPSIIKSMNLLPEISITDGEFTISLPPERVKAEGLETLSGAARAFLAPGCNEYTQGFLTEAVEAVLKNLEHAISGCPVARTKLHNAASLAGAAYGNVMDTFPPLFEVYPTATEKADKSERLTELAKAVGFASGEAFLAACEKLQ